MLDNRTLPERVRTTAFEQNREKPASSAHQINSSASGPPSAIQRLARLLQQNPRAVAQRRLATQLSGRPAVAEQRNHFSSDPQ